MSCIYIYTYGQIKSNYIHSLLGADIYVAILKNIYKCNYIQSLWGPFYIAIRNKKHCNYIQSLWGAYIYVAWFCIFVVLKKEEEEVIIYSHYGGHIYI